MWREREVERTSGGMCAREEIGQPFNIEVDAEGGGLGDEDSNYAFESGIERSAAESEKVLQGSVALAACMRNRTGSKRVLDFYVDFIGKHAPAN